MKDSISNAKLKALWSAFQVRDKRHSPPKLKIQLFRTEFFKRSINNLYYFFSLFCPLNRGVLRVLGICRNPSSLNHQIKRLVNAFYRYFLGHRERGVSEPGSGSDSISSGIGTPTPAKSEGPAIGPSNPAFSEIALYDAIENSGPKTDASSMTGEANPIGPNTNR